MAGALTAWAAPTSLGCGRPRYGAPRGRALDAEAYIDVLATMGQYHFTTADVIRATRAKPQAVRRQLHQLSARGLVGSPLRSFFVVIPPEYRGLGCPPAELFLDPLMTHIGAPYYLCLRSAADRYHPGRQAPPETQVMVPRNRKRVRCGGVQVSFIARADVHKQPVRSFATARGRLRCATPELTTLELVGYPGPAGGLENIDALLRQLRPQLCAADLVAAARLSPPAWSQRLGYLLEAAGATELSDVLGAFLDEKPRSYTPLRRSHSLEGANYVRRWKLIVNVALPG